MIWVIIQAYTLGHWCSSFLGHPLLWNTGGGSRQRLHVALPCSGQVNLAMAQSSITLQNLGLPVGPPTSWEKFVASPVTQVRISPDLWSLMTAIALIEGRVARKTFGLRAWTEAISGPSTAKGFSGGKAAKWSVPICTMTQTQSSPGAAFPSWLQ